MKKYIVSTLAYAILSTIMHAAEPSEYYDELFYSRETYDLVLKVDRTKICFEERVKLVLPEFGAARGGEAVRRLTSLHSWPLVGVNEGDGGLFPVYSEQTPTVDLDVGTVRKILWVRDPFETDVSKHIGVHIIQVDFGDAEPKAVNCIIRYSGSVAFGKQAVFRIRVSNDNQLNKVAELEAKSRRSFRVNVPEGWSIALRRGEGLWANLANDALIAVKPEEDFYVRITAKQIGSGLNGCD